MAMWRPKERIKHLAAPGRWPDLERARSSALFQPIQLGATELNDRTWVPAMVPWRASDDGYVTPDVLDWYRRFAEGRPGAIVVEATGIRDIPSGPLLRIGDDRFLPDLTELVETVKASQRWLYPAVRSDYRFPQHSPAPFAGTLSWRVPANDRRASHAPGPACACFRSRCAPGARSAGRRCLDGCVDAARMGGTAIRRT